MNLRGLVLDRGFGPGSKRLVRAPTGSAERVHPSRQHQAASLTSRASLHQEALGVVWLVGRTGSSGPPCADSRRALSARSGFRGGPGKWKTNPHRSAAQQRKCAHIHSHSARSARVVDGSARDAGQRFAVVPGGGSGSAGPGPPRRSRRRRLVGCVCVGCVGARRRLFSRRSRSTSRQQSPLVAFRPRRQFRTAPPLPSRRAPVPAARPPRARPRPRPRGQHQQQPGHPRQ